jgi:hypothetical protein
MLGSPPRHGEGLGEGKGKGKGSADGILQHSPWGIETRNLSHHSRIDEGVNDQNPDWGIETTLLHDGTAGPDWCERSESRLGD